jgi:RNA polymerase sigma-70 factor, ECF subfamily
MIDFYQGGGIRHMEVKLLLLVARNFGSLGPILQKEIYFDYYNLVYGAVMCMVRDHATTEDILQESFIKIIKNIPQLDTESKLKAWIKVVVRNTTYNYLRKNKRNRIEIDSESVFINDNVEFSTNSGATEEQVELKTMVEVIGKLIENIQPEFRTLIEMRWKQDLSYKEIGEELGLSEDAVKYKLHRARELIKKKFLKEWGEY